LRLLDVWIESADFPIGRLVVDDFGRLQFAYTADWLDHRQSHALSLALPLSDQLFAEDQARPFFENLLIENGLRRREIARRERIEEEDVTGFLWHMGADCAGAVSCLPAGSPPVKRPGNLATDYDEIDDQLLTAIITAMGTRQPLPAEIDMPSPVAGMRDKICVTLLPHGKLGLPKKGLGVPTTHILKVPDVGSTNEPMLEAKSAELANHCGIAVAQCWAATHEIEDNGRSRGQSYLLIERFDRFRSGDQNIHRLHQEDFAQALGLPRDMKYEHHGTDQRRYCAAAIRALLDETDNPLEAKRRFLAASFFNLAIGNWDNHAKNHALIHYGGQRPMFAPLYDLVPVPLDLRYANASLSFRIGEADSAYDLKVGDFDKFFADFGFTTQMIRRFVGDDLVPMLEKLEAAEIQGQEFRRFDALIGRELARIDELLGLGLALRERDYLPEGKAGGWAIS
jgi:serine/threonine-protein kinase HipA